MNDDMYDDSFDADDLIDDYYEQVFGDYEDDGMGYYGQE